MASNIDPTIPADGVHPTKKSFRDNFSAAKTEIEALQDSVIGGGLASRVDTLEDKAQNLDTSGDFSGGTITVEDASFTLQDDVDNTKQVNLQLSSITTGTTRTLTAPDLSGTFQLIDANQTVSATHTYTGTLDVSSATLTLAAGQIAQDRITLAGDLSALEGLSSTGLVSRTASNTYAERTITGTTNEVAVSNGDGVLGNPTLSLPSTVDLSSKTVTFANDQISGDKIDGGTISNFTSTGITDNATGTAVTIDSGGKVGINTSSPAAWLEISASVPNIRLEDTDTSTSYTMRHDFNSVIFDNGGSGRFSWEFSSSEAMRLTNSGLLGLGTTNPIDELHIAASIPTVRLEDTDLSTSASIRHDFNSVIFDNGGTGRFAWEFSGSEVMRVNANGNVGIGTTSPQHLLDINGNRAVSDVRWNVYTGDGSTTTFSAGSINHGNKGKLLVAVDGVLQSPDTYSISGNDVVFSTAPGNGANIDVRSLD